MIIGAIGLLISALAAAFGVWWKIRGTQQPPQVLEAQQAGADDEALKVQAATNDQLLKAMAAGRAADQHAVDNPSSLRDPNPDSRD